MRRHLTSEQRHGAHRIWPWFLWRTCEDCSIQFRREWGWRFDRLKSKEWPAYTPDGIVCRECGDARLARPLRKRFALTPPVPSYPPPPKAGR